MPELPEVQTIVNDLNAAGMTGRQVVQAQVFWPRTIATSSPETFRRSIKGQVIGTIGRRAKFILFGFKSGKRLAVHLRMTGRFQIGKSDRPNGHVHVILSLDDGRSLWFHDTRKFGRFYLMDTSESESLLASLGPEPLDAAFTPGVLAGGLARHHRQIKPLLLDQTFIAGLGNIYVDESLWAARIHPLRRADTLLPAEVKALHAAIRHTLRQGLKYAGTTLGRGQSNFYSLGESRGTNDTHLKVFRRTGLPCERCKRPIERIVVGQRSTHLCQWCQRLQ
ncbi:MAG: hypothetical protein VR64_16435 [Desulfatitalea sp. BRH_c12]|nr:MAG: hypothetical protein VR64_16435 [Desulfatitalea sp. BRH_c12]